MSAREAKVEPIPPSILRLHNRCIDSKAMLWEVRGETIPNALQYHCLGLVFKVCEPVGLFAQNADRTGPHSELNIAASLLPLKGLLGNSHLGSRVSSWLGHARAPTEIQGIYQFARSGEHFSFQCSRNICTRF